MQQAKSPILLVITLAEPGGATQFVLRFAKYLQNQGEFVILVAGDGQWLFEQAVQAQLPIERISGLGRAISLWRDPLALWQLFRLFQRYQPRAIHLNSTKAGILGSVAAHFARIPNVVYRIGGWVFLEPLASWKRWLYLHLERWTARWKNVIVCVHPNDEQIAIQLKINPKEQIVTIPNGVDPSLFYSALLERKVAREQLKISSTGFVFGTIAHFYPAKDLANYLKACARIFKKDSSVRFVFIGDGPERKNIEQKIREYKLETAVLLVGDRPEAFRFLNAFDCFVLPSNKEGMPSALLEALFAGIPTIATDVGACRWMVGENGLIVPPQNTEALATAMQTVLASPQEEKKRAQQAKEAVATRFQLTELLEKQARLLFDR